MIGKDVKLRPIVGDKETADYFWKQVKKSGKPTKKAIKKLKERIKK